MKKKQHSMNHRECVCVFTWRAGESISQYFCHLRPELRTLGNNRLLSLTHDCDRFKLQIEQKESVADVDVLQAVCSWSQQGRQSSTKGTAQSIHRLQETA